MNFYNKVQNGFVKLIQKTIKDKYQLINSNLDINENNEKTILK